MRLAALPVADPRFCFHLRRTARISGACGNRAGRHRTRLPVAGLWRRRVSERERRGRPVRFGRARSLDRPRALRPSTHMGSAIETGRGRRIDDSTFLHRFRRRSRWCLGLGRLAWRRTRTVRHELQGDRSTAPTRRRRGHQSRNGACRTAAQRTPTDQTRHSDHHPTARGCRPGVRSASCIAHQMEPHLTFRAGSRRRGFVRREDMADLACAAVCWVELSAALE